MARKKESVIPLLLLGTGSVLLFDAHLNNRPIIAPRMGKAKTTLAGVIMIASAIVWMGARKKAYS